MGELLFHFEIPGRPITKKNSMEIILLAGHLKLIPSKQYREYEKHALGFVKSTVKPHESPCEVECHYYLHKTKKGEIPKRLPDLTNLIEATDDILVKGGVLADDNCRVIVSHDHSRVHFVDYKDDEYVEIFITEIGE